MADSIFRCVINHAASLELVSYEALEVSPLQRRPGVEKPLERGEVADDGEED